MRRLLVFLFFLCSATAQQRILVHGHRGARAVRPENTIPAFEYAIAAGADVLETDMAVTRDNVLVLSHEPLIQQPMCTGPGDKVMIHELTLAELRQWDCGAMKNPRFPKQEAVPGTRMPKLSDLFDLASRGSFEFNIETKIFGNHPEYTPSPEEFVRLVLEQIRKYKLESRVILQSFDFRTLVAMHAIAPEIRLSALIEDKRDFVEVGRVSKAAIISPEYHLVTKEKVAVAHAAGLQVVPWTANTPADWQKLVDAGVDAIISDDPAGLIAFLKSRN